MAEWSKAVLRPKLTRLLRSVYTERYRGLAENRAVFDAKSRSNRERC